MSWLSINDGELLSADHCGYALKRPCNDCPFRRDAPDHIGVAKSIPGYVEAIESNRFAHTCHKTDNRPSVDGPRNHQGAVQHCAGALHFLIRSGHELQLPFVEAVQAGKVSYKPLRRRARRDESIFASVRELLLYYLEMVKRQVTVEATDPLVCVVFYDHTIDDPPQMIRLSEAKSQGLEILECRECGKPATSYDSHWPYHCDHNFCAEHSGEGIENTSREYQELLKPEMAEA